VIGALCIVAGLGLSGWGVRAATTRPRPGSLAAALIAAAGLGLAFWGALALIGRAGP
jgi:hypothetical protein